MTAEPEIIERRLVGEYFLWQTATFGSPLLEASQPADIYFRRLMPTTPSGRYVATADTAARGDKALERIRDMRPDEARAYLLKQPGFTLDQGVAPTPAAPTGVRGLRVVADQIPTSSMDSEVEEYERGANDCTREFCQRCHQVSPIGFFSPIWKRVAGRWADSILCIACFAALGDERFITWECGLKLFPVSLRTSKEDPYLQDRLNAWMADNGIRK